MTKLLPLIWKNIRRNRRRTFLTIGSIFVSLFLFTVLLNALATLDRFGQRADRGQRIVVHHKISLAVPLPIAYRNKLEALPGIVSVCPFQWYGGLYRDSKEMINALGVDQETLLAVWGDGYEVEPAVWQAFLAARTGGIVGGVLAKRYGWKPGDKVTLRGAMFPYDLEFLVCGTPVKEFDANALIIRRDYLEEVLGNPGITTDFWCKVERAELIPGLMERIDAMFANSQWETITQSEKAFMNNFVSMLGNIHGLIGGIGTIVVLTIILVAANSIAMSVRERTTEVAVLKAIGFRPRHILTMILGESMLIAGMGGLAGSLAAYGLFHTPAVASAMGPIGALFVATPDIVAFGAGVALLVGALAGAVPAVSSARAGIVDALRRVA